MASSQKHEHSIPSNAQEIPQEDSCEDREICNITNNMSGGRNVTGPVSGGIVVQGDYHNFNQPLPALPPPTPEELKKMLER
uniref:Uncharacterized protein n=1 Tax=Plectus sambesii TaxID=2011161 RepID=A0A914WQM7_9BILA